MSSIVPTRPEGMPSADFSGASFAALFISDGNAPGRYN
jgi:hypothetical protein